MNASQNQSVQKTADYSQFQATKNKPQIQQHIESLNRHYRSAKGSVEMLTVFANPSLKSASCMVEDAELLLDAAKQLHAAMTALESEPITQNQTGPEETSCIWDPDFNHRHLCSDCQDVFGFYETINRAVLSTKSILVLNRKLSRYDDGFNRDDTYYSLITAKMNIQDIHAVNQAMYEVASTGSDVHDAINDVTAQVLNELDPLLNLLAEDTPISVGLVVDALDSIIVEIEKLKMVEADSGLNKNQA